MWCEFYKKLHEGRSVGVGLPVAGGQRHLRRELRPGWSGCVRRDANETVKYKLTLMFVLMCGVTGL